MAGFSSSIQRLASSFEIQTSKKPKKIKNQIGSGSSSGKVSKKRHVEINIEKSKKRSIKRKKNR
jgi:hypothetical protein